MAFLACALAPVAARATVPGHWDPVTATTGANIDQVALLRDASGSLHVIWHQEPQGSDVGTALIHTVISAAGKVGPPQTIVSGWAGIGDATMLRAGGGPILLFVPATRSASTLDPFQSIEEWTSGDDGATWAVAPAPIAFNGGFADPVGGALGPDGVTPFVSWGTTDGLWVHRGTDPNVPSANLQTASGFGCCGYDPGVATDGGTGAVVVAWYGIVNQGNAVYARTVDPASGAATGATVRMPGTLGTDTPDQRVGLTAVPGRPGTYAVYTGGGVTSSKILVWRVGSPASTTVATIPGGEARTPAIAVTPDGRLWVAWAAKGRIWARRSDRTRTVWGATTSIPVRAHTDTVYKLALSAQAGVLDVLAAFSPSATGGVQTWHSEMDPGLTVTTRPAQTRVQSGHGFALKVAVSDAGDPVTHALVTVAGHHVQTGTHGTVSVTLGPFTRRTTLHVTAARSGYAPGTATVRVRLR
ncbi:MAG: hypothetical protein ACXVRX_08960 [Solirubrobacteraceae bacterium]